MGERLATEAAAKAEEERKATEVAAKAEEERLAADAAAKGKKKEREVANHAGMQAGHFSHHHAYRELLKKSLCFRHSCHLPEGAAVKAERKRKAAEMAAKAAEWHAQHL